MPMKTTLLRAGALACALLTTTALTAPACAQATHPHRQPDANGVDVTYGDSLISAVEGSIGAGQAELRLIRNGVWVAGGYNVNGQQWDQIGFTRTPVSGGYSYAVTIYGRSEVFSSTGTLPTGSSLSGSGDDFVYRTADGTTIEFSSNGYGGWGTDSNYCNGELGQGMCTLIPISVSQPDGRAVSLNWEIYPQCWGEIDQEHLPCHYTGRISSVANSFGYGIEFAYNTSGSGGGDPPATWFQRTGASFTNGGTAQGSVSYSYPSTGVTEVTDMGGNVWRFTGSLTGLTGIRRPGASSDTTTISYSSGQVTSVTRDGVTTGYSRSVSGSTATMTITDAASHVTTVVSDLTIGRPTSVTDPLSRQTQYQYDSYGRLTRVTAPEGNYVQYTYDSRGNITETRRVAKSGSGLPDMVTSATYASSCSDPSCNKPLTTTDERGNVTNYTYDSTHGGVTSVTAPAPAGSGTRPQTRYTYTLANGEYRLTGVSACQTSAATGTSPACATSADEAVTTISYDANGNVTSRTRTDGASSVSATTAMTYDSLGNLLTVDGPLDGTADTTRYRYNTARQLVGVVGADPDGGSSLHHQAQRTTYTNRLPTRVEIGTVNSQSDTDWASFSTLEQADTTYDANARPTRRTRSVSSTTYEVTDMSYDSLGRPNCTAVRMNSSAWGTVTAACTPQTAGSYGDDRITRTTYDNAGEVTLVQTGYGVSGIQADEAASTYRNNGQVETVTDAMGNRTTYVYDGHDRLSQIRYPSGTQGAGTSNSSDYEQLTYATATVGGSTVGTPLVSSRRLRNGNSIGFSYDNLGRPTAKDLPGSDPDVAYAYDNLGRLTSATFSSSGQGVSNSFDALDRVTSTSSSMGGTTRTLSYQYDTAGNRSRITHPDSNYFTYNYDVLGRLILVRENGSNWLSGYSYNASGVRLSDRSYNGGSAGYSSYGYDSIGRLNSLYHYSSSLGVSWTYAYDPASQLRSATRDADSFAWTGHYAVNRSYTANGLNQYSAAGGTSFSYDSNGNLTSDGSTTFGYDSENRLVSASGGHSASLSYDPLGRLWQVTSGSNTTRFLHDGASLVAEYDGSGNLLRRHVNGQGIDTPAVTYEGSNLSTPRFLYADERGSIVTATNGSGAPVTTNTYDEHGIPGGSNSGRFQYTGQMWLPELGIYYYRARMYSPTLGRFLQTDPIGYGGGANLYAYVGGDPVNHTDPSGLEEPIIVTGWRPRPPADPNVISFGVGDSGPGDQYFSSVADVFQLPAMVDQGDAGSCVDGNCEDILVTGQRPPRVILIGGQTNPVPRQPPPPPPPTSTPPSGFCTWFAWQEWIGYKETEIAALMAAWAVFSEGASLVPGAVLGVVGVKDIWVGQFMQWIASCPRGN